MLLQQTKFTLCRYLLRGNWQDVTSKMIKITSIVTYAWVQARRLWSS